MRRKRLFPGSFSLPLSEQFTKTKPTGEKERTTMIPQKLKVIHLILSVFVCLGLAPMVQAVGPDTDGSGSETGLAPAPLITNVDDFLLINDTDNDNITRFFMESDFPTLPNWRMDNNLGSLLFRQFGGVGTAVRVVINDGGDVGI